MRFDHLKIHEVKLFSVHFGHQLSLYFLSRCGSVIVDLALKFSSALRESEVLSILQDATKNGKFGDFNGLPKHAHETEGYQPPRPQHLLARMLQIIFLTFCPLNLFFCPFFPETLAIKWPCGDLPYFIVNIILFCNSASKAHI